MLVMEEVVVVGVVSMAFDDANSDVRPSILVIQLLDFDVAFVHHVSVSPQPFSAPQPIVWPWPPSQRHHWRCYYSPEW